MNIINRIPLSWLGGGWIIFLWMFAVFTASYFDADAAARTDELYCNMVQTWETSNGQRGWPPYRADEIDCNEDVS